MTNQLDPGDCLVEARATDRYFDYCLQPYEPRRTWRGGLRGESLLWHSALVADATPDTASLFRSVQAHAGADATVWGVKHIDGQLSWELYFYDSAKEEPRVHITDLSRGLSPALRITAPCTERIPYFMWSFDVPPSFRAGDAVPAVSYYLADPVGQAGRSYRATEQRTELENVYHFFHPKREIREVMARLRSSVFVDWSRVDLAAVLLPELFTCRKICVAKKRTADAVYYSGITIDQLLFFLRRFAYPEALVSFASAHRDRFEHLLFDVGIDYFVDAEGRVCMPKSGYYSTL